jgi:hypothetical protein
MSAFSYLEMTDSNYKHCPIAIEWKKVDNIRSFLACYFEATCVFLVLSIPLLTCTFI